MRLDISVREKDEDKLGYYPFAESIAHGLIHAFDQSEEALVVGLHGPWGNGKSTLVSFIITELEAHYEKPETKETGIILKFNPWMFSGQQELQLIFLKELVSRLYSKTDTTKKVANHINDFITRLQALTKPVSPILELLPYVSSIQKGLEIAEESTRQISETLDTQQLKRKIDKALLESKIRLYITIDDIDRLTFSEIEHIFQLVKLNANFANTVFILAYDQEVVVNALDQKFSDRGQQYLEKIVQVDYGLPMINRYDLRRLLREWMKQLFKDMEIGYDLDELIEGNQSLWEGIRSYMRNIRDINRYLNAVKLRLGSIWREVDVMDFLVIEVLRIFDVKTYDFIWDNRKKLTFSKTNKHGGIGKGVRREVINGKQRLMYQRLDFVKEAKLDERSLSIVIDLFSWSTSKIESGIQKGIKTTYSIVFKECIGQYYKLQFGDNAVRLEDIEQFKRSATEHQDVLEKHIREGNLELFLKDLQFEQPYTEGESRKILVTLMRIMQKENHADGQWRVESEVKYSIIGDFIRTVFEQHSDESQATLVDELLRAAQENSFPHFYILSRLIMKVSKDFMNDKVMYATSILSGAGIHYLQQSEPELFQDVLDKTKHLGDILLQAHEHDDQSISRGEMRWIKDYYERMEQPLDED